MLAKFLLIHDVSVASLAGVVPRKRDRSGCDLTDRQPPVMAILPKTARYDCSPQDYECYECHSDDCCQPNEVFDFFEQVRVPVAMAQSERKLRYVPQYQGFWSGSMTEVTGSGDSGHTQETKHPCFFPATPLPGGTIGTDLLGGRVGQAILNTRCSLQSQSTIHLTQEGPAGGAADRKTK